MTKFRVSVLHCTAMRLPLFQTLFDHPVICNPSSCLACYVLCHRQGLCVCLSFYTCDEIERLCRSFSPAFHSPLKPTSQFPTSLIHVQYIIHYIWNRGNKSFRFPPIQPDTYKPKICMWPNNTGTGDIINMMDRAITFPSCRQTLMKQIFRNPFRSNVYRAEQASRFYLTHSNETLSFCGGCIWWSIVCVSSVTTILIFIQGTLMSFNLL
jgi:hypothetical protein